MTRPRAEEGAATDALADEAGTRAMVDLLLGATGLMLVILLAVGSQTMRLRTSSPEREAHSAEELDSLFAMADGPVIFADASGIRLGGTDRFVAVSEISGNEQFSDLARAGTPTLVIAPAGQEAAFHVTARLASMGVRDIRRIRLAKHCNAIDKVVFHEQKAHVSCRRR